MSKNNTGDRKIKRKIDDLETQLSSPLSPIGKEAVIAAEKLARKHPTDSGAVLDALILAATHTPSCQSDEKEVLKSSTSSSHPTRVVQAFIIEYLVKLELKNVDASSSLSPPFKASDIISRFRKVISNIGLKDDDEKIEDDAPWWLIIYIYAIGSMENGVDEVNEILVRNPYPSLCKAVVNEVIAINEVVDARLRPSVVICLDKVPIDTLEGLLTMGHYKGTLPEWLRRDIINRAIKGDHVVSMRYIYSNINQIISGYWSVCHDYLFKIGKVDNPFCRVCTDDNHNIVDDIEHRLFTCRKYENIRIQCFGCSPVMADKDDFVRNNSSSVARFVALARGR